ncbi:MAG: Gfo/Idh/MocA family protein, partial [Roseimicrobium sp.]
MKRRRFLLQSAAAASTLGFPAIVRCASPNSMLQVACIGVARMGGSTMRGVATHAKAKIVALCDVDADHLKEAATGQGSPRTGGVGFPDATQHTDWRQLLSDHADTFDAVTIGTPDHMHAPIAVTALRAKKHVYLQKPMAPTIHECRVITEEAAKAGVITQLGNQGRSSIEARMTVDLLRGGAIGKIKEVIFWENKPLSWWPLNEELREKADAIPATLNWDLWLGVSAELPYLTDTYHPQTWRAWRGFGCGELGDMGCHFFDGVFDALKLTAPQRVRQLQTGPLKPGMWAKSRVVEFEFPGGDLIAGDALKLT